MLFCCFAIIHPNMDVDVERKHNGTPESSNVSDADAWISLWHAKDQLYTVPFPC